MSAAIPAAAGVPAGVRLRNELDFGRVWPSFLVWLAVSICTIGLGWIVVSGRFFKLLIDTTEVVGPTGKSIGRLHCDYDVDKDLGHIVRWTLISIATLGVGLFFYSFHAGRAALNATVVEWY
jgi:hypothetical protein